MQLKLSMTKSNKTVHEELVKHIVDRFLGWRLPDDFKPDAGITFIPPQSTLPHWWPVGTNLLTATQATAMVEYMLEGVEL